MLYKINLENYAPANTKKINPKTNKSNIKKFRMWAMGGAPLNSFHIKMPQMADTNVAPWPSP